MVRSAVMSVSLTPEQQRLIEENRRRALARRAERLAQGNTPHLPPGSDPHTPPQPQSVSSVSYSNTTKTKQVFTSDRTHPGAAVKDQKQVGTRNSRGYVLG